MESDLFNEKLSGTHIQNKEKISKGYNLYEGKLIDVDGKEIKKWKNGYLGLILKDGRYLAQKGYEEKKWGFYTWDDKVIWEKDEAIHHDIVFDEDRGLIITFSKEMHEYKGRNVDFCVIIEYDLNGKEVFRWSTWENLKEIQKNHKPLELDRPKVFFLPETAKRKDKTPWGGNYDYYRINSLQIIPETDIGKKDSRFRKGNWIISIRHGSMIFILDKDTKKIVWKCIYEDVKDNIEGQHSVQMLENGRILIFDNGRYRGWSRVIEINPLNYEILWEYKSDKKEGFFTLSEGYCQRLKNGNTLITESEKGRVFEITKEGEIVWGFYHPDKQDETNSLHPESYGKRQWIYRMIRYEKDFIDKIRLKGR
jgi:hypothetical protein